MTHDPRMVGFDTETWVAVPGLQAPPIVCVSWATPDHRTGLYDRADGLQTAMRWLADGQTILVGQNIAYDMACLCAADPRFIPLVFDAYEAGRVRCTMVWQKQYEIARGRVTKGSRYDLGTLVSNWLGEDVEGKEGPDVWRMRYKELDGIPLYLWPHEAEEYARKDAHYALRVHMKQLDALQRTHRGFLPDVENQYRYAFVLQLIKCWGIRTDGDAVDELAKVLHDHVDKELVKLLEAGLFRFEGKRNPKLVQNMQATRDLVIADLGSHAPRTPGGEVSTSNETLEMCRNPALVLLRDITGDRKILNTYIPLLQRGVYSPLHPYWNVLVESGRTSCSDPNLQNQPRRKGVRECFRPRHGNVFFSDDYHTAELRSLAQVLHNAYGHSEMAAALRAGRDLHLETAAAIIGVTYEQILADYKSTDPARRKRAKDARQLAKAANFGLPGGLGAQTFVTYAAGPDYRVYLTLDQAKEIKEKWLGRFPEMRRYFNDIASEVNANGGSFVLTQPHSGRLRGGVGFCDGANSMFQGLTADGAKDALYHVVREMYDPTRRVNGATSPLYGARCNAFIHDEIFGEAPEKQAAPAALRCATVMVERMNIAVPDVPNTVDPALMRRWSKAAGDPVFDARGNLIPYEDAQRAA